MTEENKTMTTNFGAPIDGDQDSMTAGNPGPVLMQDVHLLEKLGHFDRERIPERVVHAKGRNPYDGYGELSALIGIRSGNVIFLRRRGLLVVRPRSPIDIDVARPADNQSAGQQRIFHAPIEGDQQCEQSGIKCHLRGAK